MAESYKLHRILEGALSNLSALQQGIEGEDALEAEHDVERSARILYISLTGNSDIFK